jgi:hypothetical protein
LALVFFPLVLVAALDARAFFVAMVDVVDKMVSFPAAVASVVSAIEGASEVNVATDCVESRETFDPRAALAREAFGFGSADKAKKGQLGDRL